MQPHDDSRFETVEMQPGDVRQNTKLEKETGCVPYRSEAGLLAPLDVALSVRPVRQKRGLTRSRSWPVIILWAILASSLPLPALQKGQYVPGQFGLNAGILPGPGFIYVNMEINCDTSTLNDGKRNALPAKPSLNLLAIENISYYVPDTMFLGGNLGFAILVPTIANGSLTLAQLNISGTTWGLADTWVQPFTAGWHLKRADIQVGDAIITPTGRYSQSSLSVNISANCSRSEQSAIQWQITDNGGTFAITGPLANTIILPADALPYYSVHAVGGQINFIMPARNLALLFKYEHEYSSDSHTLGDTLVFGGAWTLHIPKSSSARN